MTWATDPPAVPGVYWWRFSPNGPARVGQVRAGPGGALGVSWPGHDGPTPVAEMSGQWWGPVAPPGDGGAVVSDSDRGPATADGQPWKGV